jgi:peptidoglycan/LPS O-acetylase OafA/YrhL
MQYLKGLDGIRALSVSLVVIAHSGFGHIVPGGLGVTVFFFLSGFLITTLLQREFDQTSGINYQNFMIRRALRIFVPLYAVYFSLIFLSYLGLYPAEFTIGGVISQLAFFTNYYELLFGSTGMMDGTGILWSLAVEEHFYIIYPLVFLYLIRRNSNYLFLFSLLVIVLILFWRVYLSNQGASFDRIYLATDTRFDSIIFGVLLSIVMYQRKLFTNSGTMSIKDWLIIGFSFIILLFTLLYRDEFFRETYRYSLQGLALIPVFYYVVTRSSLWFFSWLNSNFLINVGLYSYMIYLIHNPLIHYFESIGLEKGWGLLIVVSLLSFWLSALSYRYIEKPVLRYKNRFASK